MEIEIIEVEVSSNHNVIPSKNQVIVPKNMQGSIIALRELKTGTALVPGTLDFWSDYHIRGRFSIPVSWIDFLKVLMPCHRIGQFPWPVDSDRLDTKVFLIADEWIEF